MFRVELEILDLDEKLTHTLEELEIIENTLEETVARFELAEQALEQAREDRDNQFEAFKERARVMHEYGPVSFLDVLLNAASIRDFLARLEFVNTVAKADQEMADRMQIAEDRVSERVEELARQRNTVDALRIAHENKARELEQNLEARSEYFANLSADEERYAALLEQQRETERTIQAEYQKELSAEQERERQRLAALPRPSGQLQWPVPVATTANISSGYGMRNHPFRRTREHHDGVDIAVRSGNDIVAAEAGIVRTSSRQGAYGLTVIVEHTGGMSTLYAHASQLLVSVGQNVTRGQVIAKIGSTGVSTGPHLHFEVRINGKPVDPRPYLGY
jgi:murein DD-endopeptidase MepM/ murein hydrolase activator NlpD